MSVAALSSALDTKAGEVFKTFHVLAAGGDACLPPCFIMAAVREMGYYPTPQCLQSALDKVAGHGNSLNFLCFLKLCSFFESTKALDVDDIKRYKRAFDARDSGEVSRNEFCAILSTLSEANISTSEVEVILEMLDPTHSGTIKLHKLEVLLMQYLSGSASCCVNDLSETQQGAHADSVRPVVMTDVHHPQSALARPSCDAPKSVLRGLQEVFGLAKKGTNSHQTPGRDSSGFSSGPTAPSSKTLLPASTVSTFSVQAAPLAPNGAAAAAAAASSLPSPKPTAPSPYISGTVTRATSLRRDFLTFEPFPQDPNTVVSRTERTNRQSSSGTRCVKKSLDVNSEPKKSQMSSGHITDMQLPVAGEGVQRRVKDVPTVNRGSKHEGGESSRQRQRLIPPEDLRTLSLDDPSIRSNDTGSVLSLQNADATARKDEGFHMQDPSTVTALNADTACTQIEKKQKTWLRGCCGGF